MVQPSVWLNALALFIPAMIGVLGSYVLYRKRQADLEQNLREGLLAEMGEIEYLEKWPYTNKDVPAFNFLSTSIYDSNSDSLAVLTDTEVRAVVQYYTRAKEVQAFLRLHGDILVQKQGIGNTDPNSHQREKALRGIIDKLELARQRAMLTIHAERGEASFPVEGATLSDCYLGLKENEPLLLDYDFIEEDGEDGYRVTSEMIDFLYGDILLTGRPREQDTLERNKTKLRLRIEAFLDWLIRLLS